VPCFVGVSLASEKCNNEMVNNPPPPRHQTPPSRFNPIQPSFPLNGRASRCPQVAKYLILRQLPDGWASLDDAAAAARDSGVLGIS
jgi:hypothetical protein